MCVCVCVCGTAIHPHVVLSINLVSCPVYTATPYAVFVFRSTDPYIRLLSSVLTHTPHTHTHTHTNTNDNANTNTNTNTNTTLTVKPTTDTNTNTQTPTTQTQTQIQTPNLPATTSCLVQWVPNCSEIASLR